MQVVDLVLALCLAVRSKLWNPVLTLVLMGVSPVHVCVEEKGFSVEKGMLVDCARSVSQISVLTESKFAGEVKC